jgi:hypothetical protein
VIESDDANPEDITPESESMKVVTIPPSTTQVFDLSFKAESMALLSPVSEASSRSNQPPPQFHPKAGLPFASCCLNGLFDCLHVAEVSRHGYSAASECRRKDAIVADLLPFPERLDALPQPALIIGIESLLWNLSTSQRAKSPHWAVILIVQSTSPAIDQSLEMIELEFFCASGAGLPGIEMQRQWCSSSKECESSEYCILYTAYYYAQVEYP